LLFEDGLETIWISISGKNKKEWRFCALF